MTESKPIKKNKRESLIKKKTVQGPRNNEKKTVNTEGQKQTAGKKEKRGNDVPNWDKLNTRQEGRESGTKKKEMGAPKKKNSSKKLAGRLQGGG